MMAAGDWMAGHIDNFGNWGAGAISSGADWGMGHMQPQGHADIGPRHMGFARGFNDYSGRAAGGVDTVYGYYDGAIDRIAGMAPGGGRHAMTPPPQRPGFFRGAMGAYSNVSDSFDGAMGNMWGATRAGVVDMADYRWGPQAGEVAGYYADGVGNVGHSGMTAWKMYGVRPFAKRVGKRAMRNQFGSGGYGGGGYGYGPDPYARGYSV
eukprot:TRINITY_DN75399_c0_g1_i1.p1 TRINITY_DN75399_c0_g1~~TRINITY_DN75399_c0_g1_i1.p1  ORF type:complete len:224 (+),score=19.17 TRINITY_DN75399_c0_g1_i1:51-674(+)